MTSPPLALRSSRSGQAVHQGGDPGVAQLLQRGHVRQPGQAARVVQLPVGPLHRHRHRHRHRRRTRSTRRARRRGGCHTRTTPFAIINVRQQYLRSWRRGFQYALRAGIDQTRGGLTATVITAPVQGQSGLQHQIRPHDGRGARTSAVRRLGRPTGDFGNDPEQQRRQSRRCGVRTGDG